MTRERVPVFLDTDFIRQIEEKGDGNRSETMRRMLHFAAEAMDPDHFDTEESYHDKKREIESEFNERKDAMHFQSNVTDRLTTAMHDDVHPKFVVHELSDDDGMWRRYVENMWEHGKLPDEETYREMHYFLDQCAERYEEAYENRNRRDDDVNWLDTLEIVRGRNDDEILETVITALDNDDGQMLEYAIQDAKEVTPDKSREEIIEEANFKRFDRALEDAAERLVEDDDLGNATVARVADLDPQDRDHDAIRERVEQRAETLRNEEAWEDREQAEPDETPQETPDEPVTPEGPSEHTTVPVESDGGTTETDDDDNTFEEAVNQAAFYLRIQGEDMPAEDIPGDYDASIIQAEAREQQYRDAVQWAIGVLEEDVPRQEVFQRSTYDRDDYTFPDENPPRKDLLRSAIHAELPDHDTAQEALCEAYENVDMIAYHEEH